MGTEKYLFQVWIEFGRIKLPQGYHPNHVEEEWGKLIIEMLEREKSLRPAVERWVQVAGRLAFLRAALSLYFIMVFIFLGWNCCFRLQTKYRMVL